MCSGNMAGIVNGAAQRLRSVNPKLSDTFIALLRSLIYILQYSHVDLLQI